MGSAYIRYMHLIITVVNPAYMYSSLSHRYSTGSSPDFHRPHSDLVYHTQPSNVAQGLDLGLSSSPSPSSDVNT